MANIPACCICLATDTKLTDLSFNGLDNILYNFSGIQVLVSKFSMTKEHVLVCKRAVHPLERLHHVAVAALAKFVTFQASARRACRHMCAFCAARLRTAAAFRDQCLRTQQILASLLGTFHELAKEDILAIQLSNNLLCPYKITDNNKTIDIVHSPPSIKHEAADCTAHVLTFPYETDLYDNECTEDDTKDLKHVKKEPNEEDDTIPRRGKKAKRKKRSGLPAAEIKDEGDGGNSGEDASFYDSEVKEVSLTKEQQKLEIEKRKSSSNYLHSHYKCDLCYKGFITEETYKKHVVKHDPCSGEFPCDVCHVRFPAARALRAHAVATHEKQFVCARCGHKARSRFKAKQHTRWHQGFTYNCELCGASFSKATTYLSHVRKRHARLACAQCGDRFPTRAGLRLHHARTHAQRAPSHRCGACAATFKSELALSAHRARGTADGACDTALRACEECGDSFATDELLGEHASTHERATSFACELCKRTFAKEASFRVHAQTAHRGGERRARPARTNMCEHCGATFNSKASLEAHQRRHTGEKPFECALCGKGFGTAQRLHIHARIHTGERPFQCGACPKAFRHKAALNRHNRVHTGVKPYACASCDKRFSQSNSAKLHVALVHMKLQPRPRARTRCQPTAAGCTPTN